MKVLRELGIYRVPWQQTAGRLKSFWRTPVTGIRLVASLVWIQVERLCWLWLCNGCFKIVAFIAGASQIVVTESRRLFGPYPLSIKYVVNYDFPHDLINYVERVNSCAPAGAVLTFFSERNERLAKGLVKLLEKIEYEIPDELYHLAKEYEKKESFYRNTSNGFLVPAPVRASFERPAPLRIGSYSFFLLIKRTTFIFLLTIIIISFNSSH